MPLLCLIILVDEKTEKATLRGTDGLDLPVTMDSI